MRKRRVFGLLSEVKVQCWKYKGKDGGEERINEVADGFGEIDHLSEHKLDIRKKILLETSKERCIWNLVKVAEIFEFPAEGKEKEEEGSGRDGKDLLKDEYVKESRERRSSVPAEMLVEGIRKDRKDELTDIEMFLRI